MIFFDVTKSGPRRPRSGLTRVSTRLRDSFGGAATEVVWDEGWRRLSDWQPITARESDWIFTPELFSEGERPGLTAALGERRHRIGAVFHDAIPLKHPHITWPQSVARHPGYMKLLSRFDRVWAVSAASRDELLGFWRWQGVDRPPPIEVLALGADFTGAARITHRPPPAEPPLLCLGIIEPRKNQSFLLDVCEELWAAGLKFELHVVGRVNPHFGRPIASRLKQLQRRRPLHFHEAATDATVARLYATARATVFPTIAEGCGLPLVESLWMGVPCICSDLPVLRENAAGGGCVTTTCNDRTAWSASLRRVLTDDALHARLQQEAVTRPLPTWSAAAESLLATMA